MGSAIQAVLIEEPEPEYGIHSIKLSDLPPDEELLGPDPSKELIASVTRYGVLHPIVVREIKPEVRLRLLSFIPYLVLDGRRRIKAARIVEHTAIDAVVITEDALPPAQLALSMHSTRSENPAAALKLIEELGTLPDNELAARSGYPIQTIRMLTKLSQLHPDLRSRFDSGSLGLQAAREAAKLPLSVQEQLAQLGDQLTLKAVRESKRIQADAAFGQLDLGTLMDPGTWEWDQAESVAPLPLLERLKHLVDRLDDVERSVLRGYLDNRNAST